ncbi:unnamed protein product [Clonostachys byssicola]|uniref:F-box domain-containing protein n=1 Tax=Clonostachys byssicola TaxID=160290 RepID=A0A9N9UCI4_9HYPO|nr:unnamed protein product [Clonostachys byssicola]
MESGAPTQPPSALAKNSLIGLPTELLRMIRDDLPVASRIALALTCKNICDGIGIEPLKGKKVIKLLLLLERDSPNKFVCFGCRKLRRLIAHPTLGWVDEGHEQCGDHRKKTLIFLHENLEDEIWVHSVPETYKIRWNSHSWQPRKNGPDVSFSAAHLVMIQHRYGPRYGLSIDVLKREFNFETFMKLRSNDHFPLDKYPPGGQYGLPSEEQENFKQSIYHRAATMVRSSRWPKVGYGLGPWSFGHKYSAMIIEDELHVARLHRMLVERDKHGWTLELATYHRLGRCQTPDDLIWQCLASPSKHIGRSREEVDPSFGPGCTREKWHEALTGTTNT